MLQGRKKHGFAFPSLLFAEPIHQQSIDITPLGHQDYGSSNQISYYIPTKEVDELTAGIKQGLHDSADRMSTYSEMVKRGVSNGVGETMGELKSTMTATAEKLMIQPETIFHAKENFYDFVNDQLSYEGLIRSIESVDDFWKLYVTSLDNKYDLSEFFDSLVSGKSLDEVANTITTTTQDLVQALDLEQNAGFILLVASFFWGSDQRRVGLELGRQIGDEKIQRLENELRLSAVGAEDRSRKDRSEVEDLRQQMVRGVVFRPSLFVCHFLIIHVLSPLRLGM